MLFRVGGGSLVGEGDQVGGDEVIVLVVQDATHAQTADGVTLIEALVLVAADAAHAQTADAVTIAPPVVNAPPTLRVWRWAVGNHSSAVPELLLSNIKNRRVTWRLRSSADASFTMLGNDAQAGDIEELISDVWCYRDGDLVYRGRIGPTSDDIGVDRHGVTVTTGDYRAVLERRMLYADSTLVFAAVDQADIAWSLIDDTQGRTGGALGITEGAHGPTGVTRDRTYEPGQYIAPLITQLGEVVDGFDWEIDADLVFNVFHPERGSNGGVVLDYGGIVASVQRSVDPGAYFNALRLSGADALTAETREVAGLGVLPEGRWDRQAGEPSVLVQSALDERADLLIDEGAVISPTYVVTLKPDRWEGPSHIFLGDTVRLVVKSLPRLNVDVSQRVYEVTASIDDDGKETVSLAIGSSDTLRRRQAPDLSTRVADLERR